MAALLPILHLNGYKIAGPTVLARIPSDEFAALLVGTATSRILSKATNRHDARVMAATLERALERIGEIQAEHEQRHLRPPALAGYRPAYAERLDGTESRRRRTVEGTFRAHQVPLAAVSRKAGTPRDARSWMRSYRPEELFDETGTSRFGYGRYRAEAASAAWVPIPTPMAGRC